MRLKAGKTTLSAYLKKNMFIIPYKTFSKYLNKKI